MSAMKTIMNLLENMLISNLIKILMLKTVVYYQVNFYFDFGLANVFFLNRICR